MPKLHHRLASLFGFATLVTTAALLAPGCSSDEGDTGSSGSGSGAAGACNATCDGQCVDTQTDAAHCGACGNACGESQVCVDGACLCNGTTNCDGSCVDLDSDSANCGACGTQCSMLQVCEAGVCECPQDLAACSKGCADLMTDKLNCGQCNFACSGAQECVGGACTCPDNLTFCFGQCVDTSKHTNFCGDCDTSCDSGQVCNASQCENVNSCADVPEDTYEGASTNDLCADAHGLTTAVEGASAVTISDPTLHHINGSTDTDWYSVSATEGDHICFPLDPQCYFEFTVRFTPPDPAAFMDYEVCIVSGGCGGTETCSSASDWNAGNDQYVVTAQHEGQCGFDDSEDYRIKVTRTGGQESCDPYSLEYDFDYSNVACP